LNQHNFAVISPKLQKQTQNGFLSQQSFQPLFVAGQLTLEMYLNNEPYSTLEKTGECEYLMISKHTIGENRTQGIKHELQESLTGKGVNGIKLIVMNRQHI